MSLAETITHDNNNGIIQDRGGGWRSKAEQAVEQHSSMQAACVLFSCMLVLVYIKKHIIYEINSKEIY